MINWTNENYEHQNVVGLEQMHRAKSEAEHLEKKQPATTLIRITEKWLCAQKKKKNYTHSEFQIMASKQCAKSFLTFNQLTNICD